MRTDLDTQAMRTQIMLVEEVVYITSTPILGTVYLEVIKVTKASVIEKGHLPIKISNSPTHREEKKSPVPPTLFCLKAQQTSSEKEQLMASKKILTTLPFSMRKMKTTKRIKMKQIKGQSSSKLQYNSQPPQDRVL
jgi:hypothetical protein